MQNNLINPTDKVFHAEICKDFKTLCETVLGLIRAGIIRIEADGHHILVMQWCNAIDRALAAQAAGPSDEYVKQYLLDLIPKSIELDMKSEEEVADFLCKNLRESGFLVGSVPGLRLNMP